MNFIEDCLRIDHVDMSFEEWLQRTSQTVFQDVRNQIERRAASDRQRDLWLKGVSWSRCARTPERYHAPIHLPFLVHAGVCGDERSAAPIAVVCTLLSIGAELYDNLTDGDLPEALKAHRDFELIFAATALSCVLPPALIGELDVAENTRQQLLTMLAHGLVQTFAGQEEDLAGASAREISPRDVEKSVTGKNGAPKALFAGLAALAAGASGRTLQAYTDYGRALGVVYQLQSDFYEMFFARWCRDLAQGNRTLQIAIAMERTAGAEREEFLALLEQARTDRDAQQRVRNMMRQGRFIHPWLETLNRYVAQAEAALEAAAPEEPVRDRLLFLLHRKTPKCS